MRWLLAALTIRATRCFALNDSPSLSFRSSPTSEVGTPVDNGREELGIVDEHALEVGEIALKVVFLESVDFLCDAYPHLDFLFMDVRTSRSFQ